MKVAITGGTGGIGTHTHTACLEAGHSCIIIDVAEPSYDFKQRFPDSVFIKADLTSFKAFYDALEGANALIHLAAHPAPGSRMYSETYSNNCTAAVNALDAAQQRGIKKVVMASSINAIGGSYSKGRPRYDYFPLDEKHPCYATDGYSASKWAGEQLADAFAREHDDMSIVSLRFHGVVDNGRIAMEHYANKNEDVPKILWGWVGATDTARACVAGLTVDWRGHEAFYIVAPVHCAFDKQAQDLAKEHYPNVPNKGVKGSAGFFDCSKAERLLGWKHSDL